MQIGVLGPLEVIGADGEVAVGGVRLRALLVRLALDADRPVSAAALAYAVWGEDPPAAQANALQTLVSRLRRSLGDGRLIAQSPAGYRLTVDPDDVDALRFERLAAAGGAAVRAGDHEGGAALLRAALALWRGPALADLADQPFAAAPATRLTDLRLTAIEDRVDVDLAAGRFPELVVELEALAAEHPLRERLARQLITALSRAGRQVDALAAYERIRSRLAEELGIDPAPETQELHLTVLRGERAPTPAAPTPRGQLPDSPRPASLRAQLSSFVGRDEEIERVTKLLSEHRLITLVGPGGAGKTRLVSEAAMRWADQVPDGVWFVELAPVTEPGHVPQAVLGALGLRDSPLLERGGPAGQRLRDPRSLLNDTLGDSRAVVIMDNCEHLVATVAELVDELLARCPGLRVVTTSREPLGIVGENLLAVPPLSAPPAGASASDALAYPAVQLFADRAAAASPGFAVDDHTVTAVVEICRRLDGLPLAIELAAARLRSLPVEHVAAWLDDRFRLLTGGSRLAMPRHRTLRAVVEWSWELLTPPERRLAERIAVFPAGVTLASAEAVCSGADLPAFDVLDLTATLVDKSLLQVVDGPEPRYRMLETLREYGIERLAERGELRAIRDAHARYFARLAHDAEPKVRGPEQLTWLVRLRAENENILAAVRHLGDAGDAVTILDVVMSLSWYWILVGQDAEAATWLRFAVDVPGEADPADRLIAQAMLLLSSLGNFGDEEIGERIGQLTELSDQIFALRTEERPLLGLLKPVVALISDRTELIPGLVEEALSSPDRWIRAAVLMLRANIAENMGEDEQLRTDTAAALGEFRSIGDRWGLANTLATRGRLFMVDGDLDTATAVFEEALGLIAELGAVNDQVMLRARLADVHVRTGNLDAAAAELRQLEVITERTRSPELKAFPRLVAAQLSRCRGDLAAARELVGSAMAELDRIPRKHPARQHMHAVVRAAEASLDVALGKPERAREQLVDAYETGQLTKDMPIMGQVGIAVADLAAYCGRPTDAAEMLGAAARLTGADDPTNPEIIQLTQTLRDVLGEQGFASAYATGRTMDRQAAIARIDPTVLPPDGGAVDHD